MAEIPFRTEQGFLVVRSNGEMRMLQRPPHLRWDEVSFRVRVRVPKLWGRNVGDINLEVPEGSIEVVASFEGAGEPEVTIEEPQTQETSQA